EDEGVVVGGMDFADEMVDFDGLAPVGVVPALDLAGLDGEDLYFCSCPLEIPFGVGEFDLLVAVGGEDGDFSSIDFSGHSVLLWCSAWVCLQRRIAPSGE